ncbi:hypothetical protein [Rariglobus hedericola]|uniref:Uncharacterized protein n=1 Tax=Rariglobus hedericola TaxID=2597822 RepID=A0A556QN73_9BACT|nr:hypothetical protein [Rariglobus hedericola]TSJ78077.1 hypothetical protein FPL22_01840 [Rariglobus hedericola]
MAKAKLIFHETQRVLPLRQQELRKGAWPVLRTTLILGPLLGLLGLWIVYHAGADEAPPTRLITGLLLAPFAVSLMIYLPLFLSHVPRFAPHFLTRWQPVRHGLFIQNGFNNGHLLPWKFIDSLITETTDEEITLHLNVRQEDGTTRRTSLACLISQANPEMITRVREAINNKTFC